MKRRDLSVGQRLCLAALEQLRHHNQNAYLDGFGRVAQKNEENLTQSGAVGACGLDKSMEVSIPLIILFK